MAHSFHASHVYIAAVAACSVAAELSAQCGSKDDAIQEIRTEMMQHQLTFSRRVADAKALPTPLTWVHAPRTGASLEYTLLQIEALCPGFVLPADGNLGDVSMSDAVRGCPGINMQSGCVGVQNFDQCTESGIADTYPERAGKIVGFFRQPEVRLMSDWNYAGTSRNMEDFLTERQGCFTKLLTYEASELTDGHCRGRVPTWKEVDLAKHRVQTGYAFIGMTDDWSLSICLFNAMFNNKCTDVQFESFEGHQGKYNSSDVSQLNGFVDVYDAEVWKVARSIFLEDLQRYDVSMKTCNKRLCDIYSDVAAQLP